MLARGLRITGAASAAASAAAYALYRYERSKVPADSELVCSLATPATLPPATLKRLTVDNLMGGYDAYYLPAVWFYDQPIDATSLKQTLVRAVDKMPALAGRRCSEGISLCNTGIRFSVRQGHEGSARDWVDGTNPHLEAPRGDFADVPSACTGGEQPLFTVRVTNFADGTSAVGIASPHSLMDGKSYYEVVSAISQAHAKGGSFNGVRVPSFDGARVWEECTKAVNVDGLPTLWVPVALLEAMVPLWALAMKRLDALLPRAKVHLTKSELGQLQSAVSATIGEKKAKCSTNEALSAALFHALADSPSGPFSVGKVGTVRMVVNAQGKGLFRGVDNVAGNFSWMVDEKTPKPPGEMSLAEAASFFRALGAKWRDEASAAKCVEDLAIFHRVQDLKGWLWEQMDSVDDTLFLNNQMNYAMAKVRFGKGRVLGYHPWHSHQHVVVVAAPAEDASARLAGGVDIYLPQMYSPLLGTDAFKEKLLRCAQKA